MKKIICLTGIMLLAVCLMAQFKAKSVDKLNPDEYIIFENDRVVRIQKQNQIPVKEQLKLEDGSVVTSNGRYWNPDGEQFQLHEGEYLDIDGNRYSSLARLRQNISSRSQAIRQTHYLYEGGKLYRLRDNMRIEVIKRVELQNGETLNPNGSISQNLIQTSRLKEGECVDEAGNRYPSESQFIRHEKLRMQAMAQEFYVFEDGTMYHVQNQKKNQITKRIQLPGGLEIYPEGYKQAGEENPIQPDHGECIDAEGRLYESQNQFQQNALIRLMALYTRHFLFQNGNSWQIENGEKLLIRNRFIMQNGLVVNPDGTFKFGNLKKIKLKEGECLDPDGTLFRTQQQFQQHRITLHLAEPYFCFLNGKVYQAKNQLESPLKFRWRFANGATINPDGIYHRKNGKKEQLNNGEYLDQAGNRYESRNKFIEKIEQEFQESLVLREQEKSERKKTTESPKRATDF